MSPEGAAGHPDAVDQSSDVYLLGATLYEILTAKPPRQGSSSWELIDLARHGRPTSPRKLDPRIPRPLEAICLKAMAFQKQDRYETPLALAEDVQRFLADQPTLAFQEPLLTRFGRWARRHRRGILRGLTTFAVLSLADVSLHSYRNARVMAQREQAREQLSEFHRLADEAQYFAANTDAIAERVPYYDSDHARAVGKAALAIADHWGEQAELLPLSDARAEFLQSHSALLILMAQTALQGGQHSAEPHLALALLDKANAIQPASRGYYQLRCIGLTLLGEHDAADRDKTRANHPDTAVTAQDHFLQGELLRMGDAGSAANMLGEDAQPRREHLTNAIDEYRSALRLDPRHFWARFQLGRCLLALGRGPEAIETLSACVAIRPDSPWAYTTRGLAYALSGNSKEAINDLNQAVRLDPDFQPARLNRGIVHWLIEDTDSAIADFDAVLAARSDKRLIEAGFYRGQLLFSQQRDGEALRDVSMVLDERRDFRPCYWFRAKTLFRLGKYEDGLSDVKTFLAMEQPQQPLDKRLILGKSLRKMAQELEGNARTQLLLAAADNLQSAISEGQPTTEMFKHLGAVHELLDDSRRAIESYSQGLTLSADDVPLRNMRGWAHVGEKQYDKARDDFVESLRLAPNDPDAHAGLGFVLSELGRDDEARKEASVAWLSGADNHLVLHNVACIYARLSQSEPEKKVEHENLALAALGRAVSLSRQNSIGPDADELALVRKGKTFPASLKSRPEFQSLLSGERFQP